MRSFIQSKIVLFYITQLFPGSILLPSVNGVDAAGLKLILMVYKIALWHNVLGQVFVYCSLVYLI